MSRILLFNGRQQRSEPLERFIIPTSASAESVAFARNVPANPKEVDLPQPLLPRIRQRIGVPDTLEDASKGRYSYPGSAQHDGFLPDNELDSLMVAKHLTNL